MSDMRQYQCHKRTQWQPYENPDNFFLCYSVEIKEAWAEYPSKREWRSWYSPHSQVPEATDDAFCYRRYTPHKQRNKHSVTLTLKSLNQDWRCLLLPTTSRNDGGKRCTDYLLSAAVRSKRLSEGRTRLLRCCIRKYNLVCSSCAPLQFSNTNTTGL